MASDLERELTKEALLDARLAKDVTSDLEAGKPIKWNLLLAKQLELEKGGHDEADH